MATRGDTVSPIDVALQGTVQWKVLFKAAAADYKLATPVRPDMR